MPMRTMMFLRTSTRLMAEPALESRVMACTVRPPGGKRIGEGESDVGMAAGVGMDRGRPVGGIRKGLAHARLHHIVARLYLGKLRPVT